MKKQRNFNYQKRAYLAECTQWTGDNLPEVSDALLELGYDDIEIERGTVMARGKGKPLLCVHQSNWLRFGKDDSFKVMRPAEHATYVPIRSAESFDDWFDTYQRDGGELMLFNTQDLEAAYLSGCDIKDAEIVKLRDELDAMNSQNPVAMVVDNKTEEGGMEWLLMGFDGQSRNLDFGAPLYAHPVPAIPENIAPVFFANKAEMTANVDAPMPCVSRFKTSFCTDPYTPHRSNRNE